MSRGAVCPDEYDTTHRRRNPQPGIPQELVDRWSPL
jgi:hypothetical protein